METRTFDLVVPAGTMPCYEALPEPEGTPIRGAVVVVQEAFGVNGHIEDVTRRFAAAGFHAVAPHLFHRTGSPALGYDDFSLVMPHMQALSDVGILDDVGAAVGYLQGAGWSGGQIGVVGFCMGGRVTFLVAGTMPRFDGKRLLNVASVYFPGLEPLHQAKLHLTPCCASASTDQSFGPQPAT